MIYQSPFLAEQNADGERGPVDELVFVQTVDLVGTGATGEVVAEGGEQLQVLAAHDREHVVDLTGQHADEEVARGVGIVERRDVAQQAAVRLIVG